MFRIGTNDHHRAVTLDDAALVAPNLYRRGDLHDVPLPTQRPSAVRHACRGDHQNTGLELYQISRLGFRRHQSTRGSDEGVSNIPRRQVAVN